MSHLVYSLTVNGEAHAVRDAWIGESLLAVLRQHIGVYGTKGACEQGECGSCSVLVDGELVCACLVLAASVAGSSITTSCTAAATAAVTGVPGGQSRWVSGRKPSAAVAASRHRSSSRPMSRTRGASGRVRATYDMPHGSVAGGKR